MAFNGKFWRSGRPFHNLEGFGISGRDCLWDWRRCGPAEEGCRLDEGRRREIPFFQRENPAKNSTGRPWRGQRDGAGAHNFANPSNTKPGAEAQSLYWKVFDQMRATGIVRRIDELGRVVIPKEIRRTLRIREGDPLEISLTADRLEGRWYRRRRDTGALCCFEACRKPGRRRAPRRSNRR